MSIECIHGVPVDHQCLDCGGVAVADRVEQWRQMAEVAEVVFSCAKNFIGESCSCYGCLCERLAGIAEIIERGDRRLLASDGPAGGRPPDISLAEWRRMYVLAKGGDA